MLVYLGVIDLSKSSLAGKFPAVDMDALLLNQDSENEHQETGKSIPLDGPVLTMDEAFILRSAAIHACELIVAQAPAQMNMDLPMIDAWLWSVAKDRQDYRKLPRFVLRGMPFF